MNLIEINGVSKPLNESTMRINERLLRDVMTRGVASVPMDLQIRDVANMMLKQNVSGVAVTDHNGEIMGVITDMDLLKAVRDESLLNSTAETIMTPHVQSVNPSTTLNSAAEIMLNKHIHRLIVLSESGVGASDRPVGIISTRDIIKVLSRA